MALLKQKMLQDPNKQPLSLLKRLPMHPVVSRCQQSWLLVLLKLQKVNQLNRQFNKHNKMLHKAQILQHNKMPLQLESNKKRKEQTTGIVKRKRLKSNKIKKAMLKLRNQKLKINQFSKLVKVLLLAPLPRLALTLRRKKNLRYRLQPSK